MRFIYSQCLLADLERERERERERGEREREREREIERGRERERENSRARAYPVSEPPGGRRRLKKVVQETRKIKLATLNVGSMTGRSGEVIHPLARKNLQVLCVQETE